LGKAQRSETLTGEVSEPGKGDGIKIPKHPSAFQMNRRIQERDKKEHQETDFGANTEVLAQRPGVSREKKTKKHGGGER